MLHMKFHGELQIQTHPPHAQEWSKSLTAKGSNDVHNHLQQEIASYKGLWVDAASSHSSHCLMLFVHLFERGEFSKVKLFHCSHLAQNNPDERLLWHSSISSVYFLRWCLAKHFSIMKNAHATIANTTQTCSKPNLLPEVSSRRQTRVQQEWIAYSFVYISGEYEHEQRLTLSFERVGHHASDYYTRNKRNFQRAVGMYVCMYV